MRQSFVDTIIDLAKNNKNLFLLTGDLGFSVFEGFKKQFPKRFFDVGVAEQNMIGVAAGLALSGKTVFVYSIIPFATMRCFEQIRNDLCMQDLDVKIVGMGAGLHYGTAGSTHHAIEDISIMRSLPNMTVICPATPEDTRNAFRAAMLRKGPVYIRLGKSHGILDCKSKQRFSVGKASLIKNGDDITIIASGAILYDAKECADYLLKNNNIKTRLINMHTIKPIDKNIILKASKETKAIFSVEEHSIIGGLGSAIAEVLAQSKNKALFKIFGLPDAYPKSFGDRNYLLKKSGLSAMKMASDILKVLRGR